MANFTVQIPARDGATDADYVAGDDNLYGTTHFCLHLGVASPADVQPMVKALGRSPMAQHLTGRIHAGDSFAEWGELYRAQQGAGVAVHVYFDVDTLPRALTVGRMLARDAGVTANDRVVLSTAVDWAVQAPNLFDE